MGEANEPALVSVGYERRTADELVDLLVENAVDVLVDVRLNPISRKRGLSKTALTQALASAGIEYRHERTLGNPKENREGFRNGLASARQLYINALADGAAEALRRVTELASERRVALLCFERDHAQCHRSCITEAVLADDPGLRIELV